MPKVITAEFFRRGLADQIRCVAIAPGYCATPILKGMNQKALDTILKDVPIGRLVEPEEVGCYFSAYSSFLSLYSSLRG